MSHQGAYDKSTRLENASWRSRKKLMNKLKSVSPESLGWYVLITNYLGIATPLLTSTTRLKDSDVTRLYEPLQTRSIRLLRTPPSWPASSISKSNSFLKKNASQATKHSNSSGCRDSFSRLSLPKRDFPIRSVRMHQPLITCITNARLTNTHSV